MFLSYEENQNNKWAESISRQPQFNLRCGTDHRAKAVVWFSQRRHLVTERIGLHSARLPACCKPIHIYFLIMFKSLPRVPSWVPNGCCGTWTIYIYIYFVVAFSGRMSERATLRKGRICDKKKGGGVLSDKLEATDRMMMERTQNGVPHYRMIVHSYTKRSTYCWLKRVRQIELQGVTLGFCWIFVSLTGIHAFISTFSSYHETACHFNTIPVLVFLSSLNHVIIPKSPIGSCNVASACIM